MYAHIRSYLDRDIYPFHMPGHKRNPVFFPPDLHRYDLTEIPGMDVLNEPTGVLRSWQERLAAFFGAEESFFLVNGASAGVVAAICAVCGEGDVLYAARNGHAGMYNGMALAGAVPRYFLPQMRADGLAGGVAPEVFDDMPKGAAAFVVSPTYEGFVSDIAEIARRVHARGGILIVDEAHGAHFAFHKAFPRGALACGADIVVHSLHKTLPVPGQCALLHVQGSRVDRARLRFFLHAVQTTSPSYMLMAAADYAIQILWENPQLFEAYVERLEQLEKVEPAGRAADACDEFAVDRGKRVYCTRHTQLSAEEIAEIWVQQYKIQVEMSRGGHILVMTSVADTDEGFVRLKGAVRALGDKTIGGAERTPEDEKTERFCETELLSLKSNYMISENTMILPECVILPREAVRRPTELVSAAHAAGRIAGELIAPCPPGIALAAPGERIKPGMALGRELARVLVI